MLAMLFTSEFYKFSANSKIGRLPYNLVKKSLKNSTGNLKPTSHF